MNKAICLLFALSPLSAHATTWSPTEVTDPIVAGAKCQVHEPISYGGYIYNWPSKYDQVFWPLTDENGIWFCEKSGFTAFIGDFDKLTAAERDRIGAFLNDNPPKDSAIETRLALLEHIYALRDTSASFKNRLLRVIARWHQNLGNLEQANQYRQQALAQIKTALAGQLDAYQRLEYLYLAANYSKQFGDDAAADAYLKQLHDAIANADDEQSKNFAAYLNELAPESKLITAGGVLDPLAPK
ncbi:hypothetical protein JYB87_16590 [Shewanella avicenniae]|uniref:Tetratricopeptide repeat protein n=1 Tax=Shewanella avicenniae TaxID=2814294 RepID=A0ABX7QRK1_9GAMM|nr:hypothetical protein [Shewanella avicenniae]QSX33321.1 hypothetical protein JYB87_16590 [Shewanella avicenniae]